MKKKVGVEGAQFPQAHSIQLLVKNIVVVADVAVIVTNAHVMVSSITSLVTVYTTAVESKIRVLR